MDYITILHWLEVKKETRAKLRQIFYVPSTGMVEVVTDEFGKSTVKQDGHTNVDLQVITAEKMVDYLGTAAVNETVYDLWKRVVEKVEQTVDKPAELLISKEEHTDVSQRELRNTADNQTKCDSCHFVSGSVRGMKIHQAKHNKTKVI